MFETKDYIAVAALIFGIASFIYTRVMTSRVNQQEAVSAIKQQVGRLELDLTQIKTEMENLPTKEKFHELQISITELRGQSNVFAEQLKSIRESQQRVERFMEKIQFQTPTPPRVKS